ncbi:PREDICTED: protein RSI-1 [Nicotiana attenuata]|uniref:Protein rsi-1 n=1 Tax=Nicotiana attenuata TaxID=49451 RepID=A0A314KGW7_NICAT|nr:PREDICTED: protein RSI-1 [Nicotiana attenuata]OIT28502.1 protein rsi-1 [Nicotiana attenuata]
MAKSGYNVSFLLLLSMFLILLTFTNMVEGYNNLQPRDCKPRCTYRCSATSHKKPCMFFCQKCCATCLCVPRGVYGHKQTCPCYNNWKTQEGKPKCP